MKAVILAGGLGTRLRSVAYDIPKSMVPVLGIPFLEHQLRFLKEQGIKDIILCVYHMADKIKSYFGDGKRIGMELSYSEEDIPLGTGGALKKAEKYLNDDFLVLNGDSYVPLNLAQFAQYHFQKEGIATIALKKVEDVSRYGEVFFDSEKRITSFQEKGLEHRRGSINVGVYLLNKEVLRFIPADEKVSLETSVFPRLLQEHDVHGYEYDGYFKDIGIPESYEEFKNDALHALLLRESHTVKEAMQKIMRNGIDIVLITNEQKKLLGVVNDRIIKEHILKGGNIEVPLGMMMVRDPIIAATKDYPDKVQELLITGIRYLPIIDEEKRIVNIEVRAEKIKTERFPVMRGKAPLRISFAGGGTDLPYFFDKYGGAVINATIDKYCSATLIKRADKKILIQSDIFPHVEVIADSISSFTYDGKLDLVKAVINLLQPDFGFELYLHNDLPPGRGLGSSACSAVLVAKMLSEMMEANYDNQKIAEIAHRAEREELKIKGGWQDQYAAVTGGFTFMEFVQDKALIYPLRLKEETIKELNSHLLLCYVGKPHSSGEVHTHIEQSFLQNEREKIEMLTKLKQVAIEMKDALLEDHLEDFGRLLRESWEYKKQMSAEISNSYVDSLYEIGLKNGAYGGKLLGAGNGGYILFFYSPRKRNQLKSALEEAGGEITSFSFEARGTEIWQGKNKF